MFKNKKKKKLKEANTHITPTPEERVSTVPQNLPPEVQKFVNAIPATSEEPVECVTFKNPSFTYKEDLYQSVMCNDAVLENPYMSEEDPNTLTTYSQPKPTFNDNVLFYSMGQASLDNSLDGVYGPGYEQKALSVADKNIAEDCIKSKRACVNNAIEGKYNNNASLILHHANKICADMLVELVGKDKFGDSTADYLFDNLYRSACPFIAVDDAMYRRKYNEIEAEGAKAVQNKDEVGVAKALANFEVLYKDFSYQCINSAISAYNNFIGSARRALYNNPNISIYDADNAYKDIEQFASDVFYHHATILLNNFAGIDSIIPIAQQSYYPENITSYPENITSGRRYYGNDYDF